MESDNVVALLVALVSIGSFVVAIFTAATSAKSNSFKELQAVVELLKAEQARLQKTITEQDERITQLTLEVDVERQLRKGYERYTRALSAILKARKIPVPDVRMYLVSSHEVK